MNTKYDTSVCPCGCGIHGNAPTTTQESVNQLRKKMKGKRVCIQDQYSHILR
jgi:hypothetical protein